MRSGSKTQPVRDFAPLCLSLIRSRPGKSSDLYLGLQCFSADIITNFLFATCFDQLLFPDFQGDIVKGIDACAPAITLASFSVVFMRIIRKCPPSILMRMAPSLKGLVVFRKVSLGGCHHAAQKKLIHTRRWKARSRAYCKTRSCWTMHHIVSYTMNS